MAKWVAPAVLDGALVVVAGATRLLAVAGQPATYAEAMTGRLAESPLTPADFALAPGDVSGRKVSVAARAEVPVVESGIADHVALVSTMSSNLLYVTTCPPQALVAGGTVDFGSWSIELSDPV